jgi:hypothetical protein
MLQQQPAEPTIVDGLVATRRPPTRLSKGPRRSPKSENKDVKKNKKTEGERHVRREEEGVITFIVTR